MVSCSYGLNFRLPVESGWVSVGECSGTRQLRLPSIRFSGTSLVSAIAGD